jgi:hemoglobin
MRIGRTRPPAPIFPPPVGSRYISGMEASAPTPYEQLGGDEGIRRLVDRFYDLMDTAPEAVNVRALHATSLKSSRQKLYMFMSGWTGGPQLYMEKFGHPRLRMRHFPFSIGKLERDEWLWCMDRALDEHEMPGDLRVFLKQKLHALADHMRNRPEEMEP